jgi:hypothetical protein
MQLTYPSDIFVALSGIANSFQLETGYQYVAGMWRESLLEDLCWWPVYRRRLDETRAPTWSWASVDARIDWDYSEATPVAEVLDVKIVTRGEDPFGSVLNGVLTVQGMLYPVSVDEVELHSRERKLRSRCRYADEEIMPRIRGDVVFLALFKIEADLEEVYGILLEASGNRHGEYIRVGVAELRPDYPGGDPLSGLETDATIPSLAFDSTKGHTITII